jgi:N-acetylneuraminic acid mutarotase
MLQGKMKSRRSGRRCVLPASSRGRAHKLLLELLEDRTVPSPLNTGPVGIHATEGLLYDGAVGSFTDGNTADTSGNFTATIFWGDGRNSAGTVTGSNGQFTVNGQHTYAEQGNFPLSAVVTDNNGNSITLGGPPSWTPLAATLPPALTDYGAPVRGRIDEAATAGTNGKIYVLGGRVQTVYGGGNATAEVDAYDPASQTWTQLPSLTSGPRWSLSATTGTDGTIYVMGGLYGAGYGSSEFDAYNPTTQTWTRLPDLPNFEGDLYTRQFYAQAATGSDGTIYAVGGFYTSEVDAYNPATQTWRQVASLPSSRYGGATTTGTDGTIYSLGGVDTNTHAYSSEVDAYNPTTNSWTVLPPMPSARYGVGVTMGKDGTIYVIGGSPGPAYAGGIGTDEVDAYNPMTRTWTVLGQRLPNLREGIAAATGADGTIYAMGGDNFSGDTNEVDTYLPPGPGANTATVVDPPVSAAGTNFQTPGVTFANQSVATFTDPGGPEPVGDYSAVIYWADQSTPVSADSISYDPGTGQFSVLGSHTFANIGGYSITVSIQHESAPATVVTTMAQIGQVNPTAFLSGPGAGVTGQSLTYTIGATDPNAGLNAAGFSYSVDFGDSSQPATIAAAAGNGSGVMVSHAFAAGTYTVQVTATDQAGNSATASETVTITSAYTATGISPSTTSSPWGQNVTFTATVVALIPGAGSPSGTVSFYDGNAPIGTGTLQVINGVDEATFSTSALGIGGHTITANYGGDNNYIGSSSGSVSEMIIQATPLVTWTNPADIMYGTPLSATQLDASSNVAGTFAYTPGTGTILNAGTGQLLSVAFTPSDTTHYTSVTQTTAINVLRANQTITWPTPADILVGTALSGTQLDATVSVIGPAPAGALTYTPAAGTVLGPGSGQILSVTAAATNDYNAATANVNINVLYNFHGFLPPLNNGLSFAAGRTIPIKFQLMDANGNYISSLSAVSSLQVGNINLLPGLKYDATANQFVDNWQTKGLSAGAYTITLQLADGSIYSVPITITGNHGSAGLTTNAAGGTGSAPGGLLGGDIDLYVDNSNGDLTADELARIQDAVTAADAVTAPYGVAVTEVTDSTLADVTLNMDTTSAVGGYADGVLGCTTDAGQITIINGWNFYADSDATQIGSGQYDFETVVTHELGHALGLGHSTDSTSVMYATLYTGAVNRTLTTADLNVADTSTTGACGLHAAITPMSVASNVPLLNAPGREAFFAMLANPAHAPAVVTNTLAPSAYDAVFANPTGGIGIAKFATLSATPIFGAPATLETADDPFSLSPEDGAGTPLSPSAPPTDRPDLQFDFIPADGAIVIEC